MFTAHPWGLWHSCEGNFIWNAYDTLDRLTAILIQNYICIFQEPMSYFYHKFGAWIAGPFLLMLFPMHFLREKCSLMIQMSPSLFLRIYLRINHHCWWQWSQGEQAINYHPKQWWHILTSHVFSSLQCLWCKKLSPHSFPRSQYWLREKLSAESGTQG